MMHEYKCSTGEIVFGYDNYLKTKHWRSLREQIAMEAEYRCHCGKIIKTGYNVHHLTYKNVGHENKNDLVFMCQDCHNAIHKAQASTKIERIPNQNTKPRRKSTSMIKSNSPIPQIAKEIATMLRKMDRKYVYAEFLKIRDDYNKIAKK